MSTKRYYRFWVVWSRVLFIDKLIQMDLNSDVAALIHVFDVIVKYFPVHDLKNIWQEEQMENVQLQMD